MPHEKCAALLFLLRHAGAPGTEAGPSAEPGGAVGRGLLGAIPLSGSVFERITPRGLEFGHSGLRSDASAPAAGEAPRRRTMVFCATRHSVELLRAVLEHAGVRVAAVHGAMDQGQRNGALEAFKVYDTLSPPCPPGTAPFRARVSLSRAHPACVGAASSPRRWPQTTTARVLQEREKEYGRGVRRGVRGRREGERRLKASRPPGARGGGAPRHGRGRARA
jgi:hypothetical protein